MSRIGKKPIPLPQGVNVQCLKEHIVEVTGPKGKLQQYVHPDIKVTIEASQVLLQRPSDEKEHKAMHGLYRSLLANMVVGVSEGYQKSLAVVGVGYKASVQDNMLELHVGKSHIIYFVLPVEVKAEVKAERGRVLEIILSSIEKQLLGQVAAKIKTLRKIDPYKGKGIRDYDYVPKLKPGKAAGK